MPKKLNEEAEWVDDEVAPAAGEKTLTLLRSYSTG